MLAPAGDQRIESAPPSGARRARARLRRVRLALTLAPSWVGPGVRRLADVSGALAGLLVCAPVFLVAALAIKLTSRGPVFFRQERLGQGGRRFGMLKLRTMVVGADAAKARLSAGEGALDGPRFKLRQDPRITRVGRLLRKYSIDELPQLWNVLVGDMALVGPRPPVWSEVARYDARALRRLEVRPGLTCLWQVSGRSDLSFDQQVALDLAYIDRATPLDEVKIVLRTIPAVITGRGAY